LEAHVVRSNKMALHLEAVTPAAVNRINTDGRAAVDIAREIIAVTGWVARSQPSCR
jgi:hypothetical protein